MRTAIILALATTDRKIQILTADPSRPNEGFTNRRVLEGHEDWVRSLDFAVFPSSTTSEYQDQGEGSGDLMLASGSQDGYIRLWRLSAIPSDSAEGEIPAAAAETVENSDDLDDDMLDEFERRMTGDAAGTSRGAAQLSTKAHVFDLSPGSESGGANSETYGISLEALLFGHEGWVTSIHWSPHAISSGTPRLLSTSADNSMIIWAPEASSAAVWVAQHRFGEMNAKGLGLFGALWCVGGRQGEEEGKREVSVVANAWNGGFQRWVAAVDLAASEGQAGEEWVAGWAPTGHGLAVKDLAWDPAHEYLVSVRYAFLHSERRIVLKRVPQHGPNDSYSCAMDAEHCNGKDDDLGRSQSTADPRVRHDVRCAHLATSIRQWCR